MFLRLLAAALGVCAFCACAGASSPIVVAPADQIAGSARSRAPLNWGAATASDVARLQGGTRLYVSNWNNTISFPPASPAPAKSLSVFDISHNAEPLTPIPVGPLLAPTFIAIDDVGRLYVSNSATRSIAVFDTRNGNAELPSITAGLSNPQGIAFDRHGNLYVSNAAQINVYDTLHGNAALPTIAVASLNAGPLALDAWGKLYIPDGIGQIMVVDTEHSNATLPPITFIKRTGPISWGPLIEGMTVDASGKLYLAGSQNSILVFDTRRSNAPLPTISGNGLSAAGMVVDDRGRLYVANFEFGSGNSILVYDTTNANKLIATIRGDEMEGVHSLALQFVGTVTQAKTKNVPGRP